jgi:hypothetical protein
MVLTLLEIVNRKDFVWEKFCLSVLDKLRTISKLNYFRYI